jgi:hypothetical protein
MFSSDSPSFLVKKCKWVLNDIRLLSKKNFYRIRNLDMTITATIVSSINKAADHRFGGWDPTSPFSLTQGERGL